MADTADIDAALLAATDAVFRKVARVVYTAAAALRRDGLVPDGVAEAALIARVQALVADGRIEGVGNLDEPRFSEIRLPAH